MDESVMSKGPMTPVKFAALVFFEEFNGASRGRKAIRWKMEDRCAGKRDPSSLFELRRASAGR